MLIDDVTGAFASEPIKFGGGPGLFEVTSVANNQLVILERLGGDGVTWVTVGDLGELTGNGVINFDLDKCILRLNQESGTSVFGDIRNRRVSL